MRKIDSVIQKCPLGELTRPGRSSALCETGSDDTLTDTGAPMSLKLHDILPGEGGRFMKTDCDAVVERFPGGVTENAVNCPARWQGTSYKHRTDT